MASTCTSLSTSSNQIPLSIEQESSPNDNHIHNHRSTTINRIRSRSTSKQIPSIITTSPSTTSSIHPDTSTSTSTTLEHPSSIDRSTISTPDFTLNSSSSSSTSTSTSPRRIALIRAHTSTVQSTSIANPTSDPSGKHKSKFNLHRSNSDRNLHSLNNTRDPSESSSTSSDLPLQRPALPSRMTSFISSFITRVSTTNNSDEDSSKTTTISDTSRSNSLDEKSGLNHSYYNNLVMPFARTAGPDAPFPYGFSRGLNNDSPPLTPTSENDGRISNEDFPPSSHQHEHHHQQNQRLPYHTAKHQWSTAQANADASNPTMINGSSLGSQDYASLGGGEISPISRSWAFSPPLTIPTSSSRSSPVQSLRAFSPPVRPGSNSSVRIISTPTPLGLLPSHSEDSTMMTGYPSEYDYHPGKSPPPIDHTFSSSENQNVSTSTSTNLNLTSTRLRLSLQSLIPRSLSRNQNRSTSSSNREGGERISWKLPPLRPHLPTIMSILIFLVFSTISLTMALSTLPLHLPRSFSSLTLNEIRELCSSLKIYSESSNQAYLHTLTVMSSAFVFLHTFNVPGSLLLNVLFGATFGTTRGTIWTSLLTAIGGTGCYLICSKLAPIIKAFPGLEKPLNAMRKALTPKEDNVGMVGGLNRRGSRLSSRRNSRIQTSSSSPNQEKFPISPSSKNRSYSPNTSGRSSPIVTSPSPSFQNFMSSQASNDNGSTSTETKISSGSSLWSYLLLLRVLPIVPYGVMNVACGVLGVPILPFFGTLGIGSIPWNAVTAQSGELLLDLAQAVSEGFEDLKVSDIPNQISEKLTEFDLLNLSIDNEDLKLNSKVMIKETKEVAKSGLKIILKRIWKKEMLIRLGLLTLIVLLPILIATLLKKRKERKDRELLENMRLLREEEEEVLDEEEGRIGEQDFDDDEDEKLDYQDDNEESEMRSNHDENDDGLPVSNSTSSNWSRYSWNSGFSNSEISGNSSRLGHKRMATDG